MIIPAVIVSVAIIIGVILYRRCSHEWVIIKNIRVWDSDISTERPVGTKYVLQCTKCGAIKKKEV